jgi:hypothetical protein
MAIVTGLDHKCARPEKDKLAVVPGYPFLEKLFLTLSRHFHIKLGLIISNPDLHKYFQGYVLVR